MCFFFFFHSYVFSPFFYYLITRISSFFFFTSISSKVSTLTRVEIDLCFSRNSLSRGVQRLLLECVRVIVRIYEKKIWRKIMTPLLVPKYEYKFCQILFALIIYLSFFFFVFSNVYVYVEQICIEFLNLLFFFSSFRRL